jgi:hypothetical protein
MKVETDIIDSIATSPTKQAVILVIKYVEIFKTDVIVFISDVKMCLIHPSKFILHKFSVSIYLFIGKLDIFSLMCATDKVGITEPTLIHKHIFIKYITDISIK